MTDIPTPPSYLKDKRAVDRWQSLWLTLDRSWVNPEQHGDTVAMYSQCYADYREALEKIGTLGALVKDNKNRVAENPYVRIRDRCIDMMVKIGEQLGLRPDSPLAPKPDWEAYQEALLGEDEQKPEATDVQPV